MNGGKETETQKILCPKMGSCAAHPVGFSVQRIPEPQSHGAHRQKGKGEEFYTYVKRHDVYEICSDAATGYAVAPDANPEQLLISGWISRISFLPPI